MLIQPGAIAPVPSFATVPAQAVASVLQKLTASGVMQDPLDRAFRRLESAQPELAAFIAGELSELEQPSSQALGYFLFLTVYLAFEEAFSPRLRTLDGGDLDAALELLVADGEVRGQACIEGSYSEDVIAVGQPALMDVIRVELTNAAKGMPEVDHIMQALLVEVLALTRSVPAG